MATGIENNSAGGDIMKLRLWVAVFVCINLPCLVSAASFEGLGVLPDATFSIANDISPDGHVAVGASGGVPNRPYYWTHSSGMKELPGLLGFGSGGTAHSSSYDGSVIVGSSESSVGNEAYYWTQSEGTVGLGYLDEDGSLSYAEGVSADGLTIVGRSVSANRTEAFMWTADVNGCLNPHVNGEHITVDMASMTEGARTPSFLLA